ncbi:MAG: DUF2249 domain-containing protein [Hyphomicrobiales bacterium]|nr:DUF2249 domain-containing protein [Hyphomicrobiales bacterium]
MSLEPEHGSRVWRSADGFHIDVRGLEPPAPMVEILRLIDGEPDATVVIAHLDREPIFLYPELEDRGWAHEIVPHTCSGGAGGEHCDDAIELRLERWGR